MYGVAWEKLGTQITAGAAIGNFTGFQAQLSREENSGEFWEPISEFVLNKKRSLELYRIEKSFTDSSSSIETKFILDYKTYGNIISISTLKSESLDRDILLLLVEECKMISLAFDSLVNEFKIMCLHSFEEEDYKNGQMAFPCLPRLLISPDNSYIAIIAYQLYLLIIPVKKSINLLAKLKKPNANDYIGGEGMYENSFSFDLILHLQLRHIKDIALGQTQTSIMLPGNENEEQNISMIPPPPSEHIIYILEEASGPNTLGCKSSFPSLITSILDLNAKCLNKRAKIPKLSPLSLSLIAYQNGCLIICVSEIYFISSGDEPIFGQSLHSFMDIPEYQSILLTNTPNPSDGNIPQIMLNGSRHCFLKEKCLLFALSNGNIIYCNLIRKDMNLDVKWTNIINQIPLKPSGIYKLGANIILATSFYGDTIIGQVSNDHGNNEYLIEYNLLKRAKHEEEDIDKDIEIEEHITLNIIKSLKSLGAITDYEIHSFTTNAPPMTKTKIICSGDGAKGSISLLSESMPITVITQFEMEGISYMSRVPHLLDNTQQDKLLIISRDISTLIFNFKGQEFREITADSQFQTDLPTQMVKIIQVAIDISFILQLCGDRICVLNVGGHRVHTWETDQKEAILVDMQTYLDKIFLLNSKNRLLVLSIDVNGNILDISQQYSIITTDISADQEITSFYISSLPISQCYLATVKKILTPVISLTSVQGCLKMFTLTAPLELESPPIIPNLLLAQGNQGLKFMLDKSATDISTYTKLGLEEAYLSKAKISIEEIATHEKEEPMQIYPHFDRGFSVLNLFCDYLGRKIIIIMILSNEDILIYESFETNLPLVVNQKIFGFRFKKYHNKYAFMNIDSPNQMHEKTKGLQIFSKSRIFKFSEPFKSEYLTILGKQSLFLFEQEGRLFLHKLSTPNLDKNSEIKALTYINNPDCSQGIAFADQNSFYISQFDLKFNPFFDYNIKQFNYQNSPRSLILPKGVGAVEEEKGKSHGKYFVASFREVEEARLININEEGEKELLGGAYNREQITYLLPERYYYSVSLIKASSGKIISNYKFGRSNYIQSMSEVQFSRENPVLVVGVTESHTEGEEASSQSSLYIFDIKNYNFEIISNKVIPIPGVISYIGEVRGNLAVAIGSQFQIYHIEPVTNKLIKTALYDTKFQIRGVSITESFIICGDIEKSLHFLNLSSNERSSSLNLLSHRNIQNPTLASSMWIDKSYTANSIGLLIADTNKNITLFNFESDSQKRIELSKMCEFHLGIKASKLLRYKLVGSPNQEQAILYSSFEGEMGVLLAIDEKTYKRLSFLTENMTQLLPIKGGVNPRAFRDYKNNSYVMNSNPKKGILDLGYLMNYINLTYSLQRKIARNIGTSREHLLLNLQQFMLLSRQFDL